jgi:ABC-type nitrate/sulfonate/bicarbonate transport system substrate-binding protein
VYVDRTARLLPYWAASDGGAFARNGLAVSLQQVADVQTAYTVLLGGAAEIYLTPLTPTLVARAANGADLAILGGSADLAIITTRPILTTREAILERFLRGVLEGIHDVRTRPEAASELLARQGVAADAASSEVERVPYLSPADLEPLIAAGAAQDPRAQSLDPNRLLDQSLLRRLEASGFVAALYRA